MEAAKSFVEVEGPDVEKADAAPMIRGRAMIDFMVGLKEV